MPGGGQPIVVGGGIQLTGGAIDEFLVLTSITPPAATTSPRLRRSGTSLIMEFAAGRDNTVIGPGATAAGVANTPEVLIGKNVTSALAGGGGTGNLGIGQNIGFTAATGSNLIIGDQPAGVFPKAGLMGNALTIVGRVSSLGAAPFIGGTTAVGQSMTLAGTNQVVLGQSVSATGNDCIVIGHLANTSVGGNVIIGDSSGAAGASTIIVGQASTGTGTTAELIAIGAGITVANLSAMIVIGMGATVTGLAAGDIVIGHNNSGGVGFSTRVVWGGANLHTNATAVPAWTFRHKNAQGTDINAGDVTWTAPLATGNAVGASIIFQTSTPGATGAVLQTAAEVARFNPGTATEPRNFQITINKGLWFTNQTSGAGAAVGTLNNAPTAGDPNHWLRTRINGVDHFIPCWL